MTNEIKSGLQTLEERALLLVRDYLEENLEQQINPEHIKLVWFCKTLRNWKAMIADISPGGYFFEISHNGDKKETYLDAYKKIENRVFPD